MNKYWLATEIAVAIALWYSDSTAAESMAMNKGFH